MNLSRRQLYAMGEPFGESATREEAGRRIYGGGGGGGESSSSTAATVPDELKPAATALSNMATRLGNTPYQAYGGQGVADLNSMQQMSMGLTANRALGGDATINAGKDFIQSTLQSGSAGATRNPVGGVIVGMNNSTVSAGSNPYAQQMNPYLDQMVQKAQDSVRSNFNTAAVNSGSFGNSGLQEQYAQGLGDVAAQMYGDAYNTQAQLAESGLNRSMNAQQFNSGVVDSNLARSMEAQQFNAQMGNDWASRNDSVLQNWKGNQLNAAQLGLNYGNQAYNDASQLYNMGQQAQNNTQDKLDFGYQQYLNQQDYPLKQMQALTGVLGQNMGSTTQTTQSGGGK